MIRRIVPWAAYLTWLAVLTGLSSVSGSRIGPMPFAGADKVAHIVLFALGSVPLAVVANGKLNSPLKVWIVVVAVMAFVGLADEFHQLFTPGRSGMDPGDLTADILGSAAGALCAILILHGRRSKSHYEAPGAGRAP
jgi:VanZ family protein